MPKFRTLELAKQFYRSSKDVKLPPHLREQFLRACSSVPLNLAEGNAKLSSKEKCRYYEIAHGSFREALAILELEDLVDSNLYKIADKLGANLYKLTRAMATKA